MRPFVEASDQRRAARDEDVAFDLFLEELDLAPALAPHSPEGPCLAAAIKLLRMMPPSRASPTPVTGEGARRDSRRWRDPVERIARCSCTMPSRGDREANIGALVRTRAPAQVLPWQISWNDAVDPVSYRGRGASLQSLPEPARAHGWVS
jgi:hypothetical protein